jgi:hypothetical protein
VGHDLDKTAQFFNDVPIRIAYVSLHETIGGVVEEKVGQMKCVRYSLSVFLFRFGVSFHKL